MFKVLFYICVCFIFHYLYLSHFKCYSVFVYRYIAVYDQSPIKQSQRIYIKKRVQCTNSHSHIVILIIETSWCDDGIAITIIPSKSNGIRFIFFGFIFFFVWGVVRELKKWFRDGVSSFSHQFFIIEFATTVRSIAYINTYIYKNLYKSLL